MTVMWDMYDQNCVSMERLFKVGKIPRSLLDDLGSPTPREFLEKLRKNPGSILLGIMESLDSNIVIKIHGYHMMGQRSMLDELISLPFTEVIILHRKDSMKQYVSYLKALKLRQWTGVDTTDTQVTVDFDEFLKFNRNMQEWYSEVRQAACLHGKRILELTYEKVLEGIDGDPEPFRKEMERWFSETKIIVSRSRFVPWQIKKQDRSTLEDSILNWDEIRSKLDLASKIA